MKGEKEKEREGRERKRDAWLRCRYAAKSNLKEWLVHLFHGWNNGLLNTLPSRTFQGVCWHYAALSTAQWRIVLPPPPRPLRSSTFSTVRKYRGIEIGGRQLLLLATLEKRLNLIWLVPEILSLAISCQSFDSARIFSPLIPHNYYRERGARSIDYPSNVDMYTFSMWEYLSNALRKSNSCGEYLPIQIP